MKILLIYLLAINLIGIALTIHDKRAAQRHRWRVPEATLLWVPPWAVPWACMQPCG